MYMRLLRLSVDESKLKEFRSFYRERVVPVLAEASGCRFTAMLRPTVPGDDYISLTIWASESDADEYEAGGEYQRLLDESASMRSAPVDWVSRPAGQSVVFEPVRQDPEAEVYEMSVDEDVTDPEIGHSHHVRIVSHQVKPGLWDEFKEIYDSEVMPALRRVPGNREAFVIHGERDDRALSVTIWNREEDAVRYELSGEFDRLARKLSSTLSGFYQWKMGIGGGTARDVGADDLDVRGYRLIDSEAF